MSETTKPHKLWDEYIRWSLLSPNERGSVSSKAEWARAKGVSDRTLRRWEQDERFKERMSVVGEQLVSQKVERVVEGSDMSSDEVDYQLVKSQLVDGAKAGNQKALDLYFRTYGKQFVEEEAASRVSDFANMDLDALVLEAVTALGEDLVAGALRSRGWDVARVSE